MTLSRRLPIPIRRREFTIRVDGQVLPRSEHLLSLWINNSVNRIATARLVFQDGSASDGDFPLSNADTFKPGAEVEFLAGDSSESELLFKGVVEGHKLRVRSGAPARLIVDCKHHAVRMTVARHSAYFFDQSDSDVISRLFEQAGISADVSSTGVTHKQLVQFHATDWDFCLMRAQANGLVVLSKEDGAIEVKSAEATGDPVITLQYGATILDLDLELDSRHQYKAVKTVSWDMANQALIEKAAADPGLNSPGNIGSAELSEVMEQDEFRQQHSQVGEDELQAWADALWHYSQANRVNGRLKCEGIGSVKVGDVITLSGVGERFNGNAYVSAVRHDYDISQGWKTHFQVGGIEVLDDGKGNASASPSAGLLPSVNGLQIGIVVSNEDPDGEFRVRVRMPLVDNDDEGTWARVSCLDAGEERGVFFRPEVGDEVVLGFLEDDPRQAVVLGMLHSSAKPAPAEGSDDNHEKLLQTRSRMKLSFDDENVVMKLETPEGNSIVLSEQDQAIVLTDQHDNSITLNADGITLQSASALNLKADTDIKLESSASIEIKAGSELKLEGSAGAELSSSATTRINGSLVNIN